MKNVGITILVLLITALTGPRLIQAQEDYGSANDASIPDDYSAQDDYGLDNAQGQPNIAQDQGVAPDQNVSNIDDFYDSLAPYGQWINDDNYGLIWVPREVSASWQPYTDGHWAYTDEYGWVWVSDNNWGWATDHYGGWNNSDDYGWYWVPGTTWAPAWVDWCSSGNWSGWAPLPCHNRWSGWRGHWRCDFDRRHHFFDHGHGWDREHGWNHGDSHNKGWNFVHNQDFDRQNLHNYMATSTQKSGLLQGGRFHDALTMHDGRVVNHGVAPARLQQLTGQPVNRFQLTRSNQAGFAQIHGNNLALYQPNLRASHITANRGVNSGARTSANLDAQGFNRSRPLGGSQLDATPGTMRNPSQATALSPQMRPFQGTESRGLNNTQRAFTAPIRTFNAPQTLGETHNAPRVFDGTQIQNNRTFYNRPLSAQRSISPPAGSASPPASSAPSRSGFSTNGGPVHSGSATFQGGARSFHDGGSNFRSGGSSFHSGGSSSRGGGFYGGGGGFHGGGGGFSGGGGGFHGGGGGFSGGSGGFHGGGGGFSGGGGHGGGGGHR